MKTKLGSNFRRIICIFLLTYSPSHNQFYTYLLCTFLDLSAAQSWIAIPGCLALCFHSHGTPLWGPTDGQLPPLLRVCLSPSCKQAGTTKKKM